MCELLGQWGHALTVYESRNLCCWRLALPASFQLWADCRLVYCGLPNGPALVGTGAHPLQRPWKNIQQGYRMAASSRHPEPAPLDGAASARLPNNFASTWVSPDIYYPALTAFAVPPEARHHSSITYITQQPGHFFQMIENIF
jgi:hypothetical protein